jgi:hypothetical protein
MSLVTDAIVVASQSEDRCDSLPSELLKFAISE